MVGNDIVDLAVANEQSNWQRPRFLEKLFTPQECSRILRAKDPCIEVWRFWSMKEAAYKLYTQARPSRFYNPIAFECLPLQGGTMVNYLQFKCYVNTRITSEYIISEARLNQCKMTSKTVAFHQSDLKAQSTYLNDQLLKGVAKLFGAKDGSATLVKESYGIPIVVLPDKKVSVSLTHHGRYGAYAIA